MEEEAHQLLSAGDIDGARAALVEVVRQKPADQPARMFLFQLLALVGEREKAAKQLGMLAQLSPEAQMLAVAYSRALAAEDQREMVFSGKADMPLAVHSDWAVKLAEAIGHFAAGRTAQGEACREDAFDAAPDCAGTIDGKPFDWIADADSRFGPSFEAIINGQYGLVPFDQVESIVSEGPRDLRDLVWYPVQIAMRSGQSVAGFIPTRYPETENANDGGLRLARATDWVDCDWGQSGQGQRLWVLSNDDEVGLLSVRELAFDPV